MEPDHLAGLCWWNTNLQNSIMRWRYWINKKLVNFLIVQCLWWILFIMFTADWPLLDVEGNPTLYYHFFMCHLCGLFYACNPGFCFCVEIVLLLCWKMNTPAVLNIPVISAKSCDSQIIGQVALAVLYFWGTASEWRGIMIK